MNRISVVMGCMSKQGPRMKQGCRLKFLRVLSLALLRAVKNFASFILSFLTFQIMDLEDTIMINF